METQLKKAPENKIKNTSMQKIISFLWFNDNAEEAVTFYTSVFRSSRINRVINYSEEAALASGRPAGSVMTIDFELEGQSFVALNGGPFFTFSPAMSFFVNCNQKEYMDRLWKKLSENGMVLMELDKYPFSDRFGWVQDKFGLNWQLILSNDAQKINPCLMFCKELQGKAEEAIRFYTTLFDNSEITALARYEANEPGTTGSVKHAAFTLSGQKFTAMDSGAEQQFSFTPAISFLVNCESQAEIDHFWDKLTKGGDESAQQCGWLKDKYGVSWQIVPSALSQMLNDHDPGKAKRVMTAMMKMKKIDMIILQRAYAHSL